LRGKFLDCLFDQMMKDQSIYFLTADMGINLVERFEDSFPDRYLNVGIAEQNLIGVAAGLAESGRRPFVYTISNFLVHRCLEQVRNDVVLHKLPITLVGTSTGFDNAPLGPTHHMLEDWGIIATLPGIKVFSPYNVSSTEETWDEVYSNKQPAYVRLSKGSGLQEGEVAIKGINRKVCVISYGSAARFAFDFAKEKEYDFLPIHILGTNSYQALDTNLENYEEIVVVEDHFCSSGMYSYLCQWKNESNLSLSVKSIAPIDYQNRVGLRINDFMKV